MAFVWRGHPRRLCTAELALWSSLGLQLGFVAAHRCPVTCPARQPLSWDLTLPTQMTLLTQTTAEATVCGLNWANGCLFRALPVRESSSGCIVCIWGGVVGGGGMRAGGQCAWTRRLISALTVVDIGVLHPVPLFRAHTPTPQLLSISVYSCLTYWELPSAGGASLCRVKLLLAKSLWPVSG